MSDASRGPIGRNVMSGFRVLSCDAIVVFASFFGLSVWMFWLVRHPCAGQDLPRVLHLGHLSCLLRL